MPYAFPKNAQSRAELMPNKSMLASWAGASLPHYVDEESSSQNRPTCPMISSMVNSHWHSLSRSPQIFVPSDW